MDRHSRELTGYGVAVAAVALALVIKVLFSGLGADHPFVLLPAAVIVSAWYGGRGPGLVAAGLSPGRAGIPFPPPARMRGPYGEPVSLNRALAAARLVGEIKV